MPSRNLHRLSESTIVSTTYIISSQDSQMEGHELQGDDAEDALQTVHCLWQLNSLVGILSHVRVILATEDDGPALEAETQTTFTVTQTRYQLLWRVFQCMWNMLVQSLPIWQ